MGRQDDERGGGRGGRVCRRASARGGRDAEKSFRNGGDAAEGAARRRGRGGGTAGRSRNITKVMLLEESCRPRGPFENFVNRSVFLWASKRVS